jgi:AraC family transcriptional regulator
MCTVMRPAVADYPAGAQTPFRVIDDFELVWMLQGQARLIGDDREWALGPGELVLVPPGVRHGYVHFEADDLALTEVGLWPMTADDPLGGLCAYLLWLGRGDRDDWEVPAERALRLVLALLASGPLPPAEPSPPLAGPLVGAIDHLRREWSRMPLRRVAVGELASAAAVSRGYLGRMFTAAFGVGAGAALERLRCARAETLLARTDLTLDAVARQCGFADVSHFSHRFTAIYGLPPSVYRRRSRPPSVLDDPGIRRLAGLVWD